MCGVCAVVGRNAALIGAGVEALEHRGPDDQASVRLQEDVALGHTRLSILDLDERSRCPMTRYNVTLVYNGECWNYLDLRAEIALAGHEFSTTGDTEVVAAALALWGVGALERFEGMFALAWWDASSESLYAARDRFGEIPLHIAPMADGWALSSEIKALPALGARHDQAEWVGPGEWIRLTRNRKFPVLHGGWNIERETWYAAPAEPIQITAEQAGPAMRSLLERACGERSISDVPVCTLLSGGIDSTAVAYHLRNHVGSLTAYTAVYNPKSQDARMAREAAKALGIELREVVVPLPGRDDLAEIVRRIEMPYKAQVEIAWPCWHLAQQIAEDGFKVVFSGEGSDELWASYGFTYHVLTRIFGDRAFGTGHIYEPGREREWCEYRRDTFTAQHRKNFARCNKVFMAHGIECRLPFLHTPLVEFALSVPVDACVERKPGKGPSKQKAVMYEAYDGLVPEQIVRRHKVAFQEGMKIKEPIEAMFGSAVGAKMFYNGVFKEAYA